MPVVVNGESLPTASDMAQRHKVSVQAINRYVKKLKLDLPVHRQGLKSIRYFRTEDQQAIARLLARGDRS